MKHLSSRNLLLRKKSSLPGMLFFAVIFTLLLFHSNASPGQVVAYNGLVTEDWAKRWSGMGNGNTSSLAMDAQGNVYATGANPGVIKYNASGMQQWAVKYNPNAFRVGGLAVDAVGNVYLAKTSYNDNASDPNENYVIRKLSASGDQQWQAMYDHVEENDLAKDIAVDADGNVYVTGISLEYGAGGFPFHYDYATVKYNALGQEQWVARYDGGENLDDYVTDLEVDSAGNVYVTGYSEGEGIAYATIKYNTMGEALWVAKYEGLDSGNNYARDLALGPGGNVYVTGSSEATGTGVDFATIKYSPSGMEQWVSRYNGPESLNDEAFSLKVDMMGNVYVAGNAAYGSGIVCNHPSLWTIVKYNTSGAEEWVSTYQGTAMPAIEIDWDRNVYVTGGTFDSNCDQTDIVTVKWSSSGIKLWDITYDGPESGDDYGTSLLADSAGNIYVTGSSPGNGTNDLVTIKYMQASSSELIAVNDVYETEEGIPLQVAAPGVLANDSGPAGATLTAALVAGPTNGVLSFNADGAFIYTPDSSFAGGDSFTYKAVTDTIESNIATVNITVNPPGGGNLIIHKINAPHMPHRINSEISASAIYTGSDIASATWYWGDGSSSTGSIGDSLITGSHSYSTAGIYNLSLTISDAQGDSASLKENFVVVYNPNAEFVAGVGSFYSPAGSYLESLSMEGNVYFAFGIPATDSEETRGKLIFRSGSGNIRFLGSTFESMSVAGDTAKVEGTGIMNGYPNHSFILSVVEYGNREDPDYIRLQVWDANDALVYDNQMGDAAEAVARTPVKKGAIIVNDKATWKTHPEHLNRVTVYPVPFTSKNLWLKFPTSEKTELFTAVIHNTKGKKIAEKQFIVNGRDGMVHQWQLNHDSWPSGVYILTLEGASGIKQLKIKK